MKFERDEGSFTFHFVCVLLEFLQNIRAIPIMNH